MAQIKQQQQKKRCRIKLNIKRRERKRMDDTKIRQSTKGFIKDSEIHWWKELWEEQGNNDEWWKHWWSTSHLALHIMAAITLLTSASILFASSLLQLAPFPVSKCSYHVTMCWMTNASEKPVASFCPSLLLAWFFKEIFQQTMVTYTFLCCF